ncbi:MAG: phosphinothricin acetyltransferase Pat [Rhodobacteraceae bacterium HLUCCA08]|nr:MAG: phosphinothricin acetyltransferase Pat [Rhodobacteraceae bacterium HLUCCA08]
MIRPAVAGDAGAIAALWNPYIRDSAVTFNSIQKTPEEVAALIAARPVFLIAEADGALAGFASYDQFRGGIGYARTMEHTILLAPGLAGRGLGRALMAALEDHARAAQVHTLWAGVSAENPAGVAFHARIGFERVAVLAQVGWKFGRWIDLVLMRKGL